MPLLIPLALAVLPIVLAALTLDTIRAARRMGGVPYDVRYNAFGA